MNFVALGYLVHHTGGPLNSPFSVLPFAFAVSAQLLVRVPILELGSGGRGVWDLAVQTAKSFGFSIGVAMALYAVLAWLQTVSPARVGNAPMPEVLAVIFVNLLASTMLNLFSRAGVD